MHVYSCVCVCVRAACHVCVFVCKRCVFVYHTHVPGHEDPDITSQKDSYKRITKNILQQALLLPRKQNNQSTVNKFAIFINFAILSFFLFVFLFLFFPNCSDTTECCEAVEGIGMAGRGGCRRSTDGETDVHEESVCTLLTRCIV